MLLRAPPASFSLSARCSSSVGHERRRHVLRRAEARPEEQASSSLDSPRESTYNAAEVDGRTSPSVSRAAPKGRPNYQAESVDIVGSALTRRFGLVGGLAWFGLLAFGVISEQIKTRREIAAEAEGTKDVESVREVVTEEGLRYRDLKVGGGATPQKGFLTVLHYRASADGQVFEDTRSRGKPIVFLYQARPFTGGLCVGVEKALATMRAGGKRVVEVPPELGFGASGAVLRPTEHVPDKQGTVPPNATLQYELELVQVSIPPS